MPLQAVQATEPKIILEIGAASGGTCLIWSYIASWRVITCGLEDMSYQRPRFTRFPLTESQCTVTLMSGNSHSPDFRAEVARELNDTRLDFLFIDGDHTEDGVTADYMVYKQFVRPGGLIAFHDIVKSQPLPTSLWKRLKPLAEVEEFVNDPGQRRFGIGLPHVPKQGALDLPA